MDSLEWWAILSFVLYPLGEFLLVVSFSIHCDCVLVFPPYFKKKKKKKTSINLVSMQWLVVVAMGLTSKQLRLAKRCQWSRSGWLKETSVATSSTTSGALWTFRTWWFLSLFEWWIVLWWKYVKRQTPFKMLKVKHQVKSFSLTSCSKGLWVTKRSLTCKNRAYEGRSCIVTLDKMRKKSLHLFALKYRMFSMHHSCRSL